MKTQCCEDGKWCTFIPHNSSNISKFPVHGYTLGGSNFRVQFPKWIRPCCKSLKCIKLFPQSMKTARLTGQVQNSRSNFKVSTENLGAISPVKIQNIHSEDGLPNQILEWPLRIWNVQTKPESTNKTQIKQRPLGTKQPRIRQLLKHVTYPPSPISISAPVTMATGGWPFKRISCSRSIIFPQLPPLTVVTHYDASIHQRPLEVSSYHLWPAVHPTDL